MEASGTQNGQIELILIHGAWLSARSWENYAEYFDSWLDGVLDPPVAATDLAK